MTIRSIQNYKYTQTEIDTVVNALKQGHKVPRKLATKFRFFHLDATSEKLIHDGRTLIAMENQDVVIAEAYQATYAGITRTLWQDTLV